MSKKKTLIMTEGVKSIAITVIGSIFFSQGTSYFQAQYDYNVPRILLPIFEAFGHIGLAIGMMILGLALFYYAYRIWKKTGGDGRIYGLVAVLIFLTTYSIFRLTYKQDASVSSLQEMIDEMDHSGAVTAEPEYMPTVSE